VAGEQRVALPPVNSVTFNLAGGTLTFPELQGAFFADLGSSFLEGQEPEGSWGSCGISYRMIVGYPFLLRLDTGRRFTLGDPPPVFCSPWARFGDPFVDFFFGFNF